MNTNNRINLEDNFKIKTIQKLALTKNLLFYEEKRINHQEDQYQTPIFTYNLKTNEKKQFTVGYKNDTRLQLNSTKLFFIRTREKDNAKPQLYKIDLEGGEALELTNLPNGIQEFNVSKNNKIALIHRVNLEEQQGEQKKEEEKKEEPLSKIEQKKQSLEKKEKEKEKVDPRVIKNVVYRKGTTYLDDRFNHVYILDLEDNTIERVTEGEKYYSNPHVSIDGKYIYALQHQVEENLNDSRQYSVVKINVDTKEEEVLAKTFGYPSMSLSNTNKWLLYSYLNPENLSTQNQELILLDLDTNQTNTITKDFDNHAGNAKFGSTDEHLYFVSGEWEKTVLYKYTIATGKLEKTIEESMMIYDYDINDEENTIALNVSTYEEISQLKLYNVPEKKMEIVHESNKEWLKEKELAKVEEFKYSGDKEKEIQGWIIKPVNFDNSKKYPLVLEIHGGPHAAWSPHERSMWFEYQYLTSMGYVIFYCNPQGSSGRGYNFRDVIDNWGIEPQNDVLAGVDKVIEKGYIDTKNLFITGGSYGGYLTLWIIGHDNRFSAAVPQRGVYNLISFATTTDITNFTKDEHTVHPWEDYEKLWQNSPIAYINNVKTPTRFIHSENDFRVPISQAEEAFVSLAKNGIETDFIRYPEEGHELSRSGKPSRVIDRLEKISQWFEKYKK